MCRLLSAVAFAFSALALVSTAHGAAQLRYSWDQCDPLVRNKDFAGPAVYRQTLSAVELPATFGGFIVHVRATPPPPAWQFFQLGCPGPERFTVQPTVPGCETIPGLQLQLLVSTGVTQPDYLISIIGYIDPPLAADPTRRYGLATLEFDHALSGTTCGGESEPICFYVVEASHDLDFVVVDDYVSWNDPQNTLRCPIPPSPARAGTWGRVKAIYR